MLARILTLVLAAAAPAAGDPSAKAPVQPGAATTVSPVTVSPASKNLPPPDATVNVASDDEGSSGQFVSVWPAAAYNSRADGHVRLNCLIDVHGLAEQCAVASESPTGKGFGAAALELRQTFKLKPAMGPDGPINSVMSIAINFKAPDLQMDMSTQTFTGNPLAMHAVTMVNHPVWRQAPTFDDLAKAYPAKAGNVEGYIVAHCHVERAGNLTKCDIVHEEPERLGFAHAAMPLADKFRIAPEIANAPHHSPLWVDVPIRMPPPSAMADRAINSPAWLIGVDPHEAPGVFPPEAVAKGLTTGRGVVQCVVAPDGSMSTCTPAGADPDGLGFSEAAVKLASKMKMNLWSADGAPVDQGVVRIAIRLNLKGG